MGRFVDSRLVILPFHLTYNPIRRSSDRLLDDDRSTESLTRDYISTLHHDSLGDGQLNLNKVVINDSK